MANTLEPPKLPPREPDTASEPPDNRLYRLLAIAFLVGMVVIMLLFLLMLILLARAA